MHNITFTLFCAIVVTCQLQLPTLVNYFMNQLERLGIMITCIVGLQNITGRRKQNVIDNVFIEIIYT